MNIFIYDMIVVNDTYYIITSREILINPFMFFTRGYSFEIFSWKSQFVENKITVYKTKSSPVMDICYIYLLISIEYFVLCHMSKQRTVTLS